MGLNFEVIFVFISFIEHYYLHIHLFHFVGLIQTPIDGPQYHLHHYLHQQNYKFYVYF